MPHTSLPAQRLAQGPEEPADPRVVIRPGAPPVVEIFGEIDIQPAPQLREELLRVVRRHGSRLALASALVVGAHPSFAERGPGAG